MIGIISFKAFNRKMNSVRFTQFWMLTFLFSISFSFQELAAQCSNLTVNYRGQYGYTIIGNSESTTETSPCGEINGTSRTLTIPSGSTIASAHLYWSGSTSPGVSDLQVTLNGSTVNASSNQQYVLNYSGVAYNWYSSYANVTSLVSGSGTFTVNNLEWDVAGNECSKYASYGGWVMVVVYQNAALPMRDISLYSNFYATFNSNGYDQYMNLCNLNLSKCMTTSELSIIEWEGDSYKGEYTYINGVYQGDNLLSGNNSFDGTSNYNLDIDKYNTSSIVNSNTTNIEHRVTSYNVGASNELHMAQAMVFQYNIVPLNVYTSADVSICSGNSTTITANSSNGTAPITYTWSNSLGTGSSKTVSPLTTTIYTVTATDATGCTGTDNVIITVTTCCDNPIDMDNDGYLAQDDCDDMNPNVPKAPGTPCNDNNPNTINDVIQSNGCTCAGVSNCPPVTCTVYNVSNSIACSGGYSFSIFLDNPNSTNIANELHTIQSGIFTECSDGTATLTGFVSGYGNLNVTFTGKYYANACLWNSSCSSKCGLSQYSSFSGSLGSYPITKRGPNPLIGNGGAGSTDQNTYGLSGWFNFGSLGGDFNFNIVNPSYQSCCVNPPKVYLGRDKVIKDNQTASLLATVSGGATTITQWSTLGSGSFSSVSGLTTVYTPSINDITNGFVKIIGTTNNVSICGVARDTMTLYIICNTPPCPVNFVDAGQDRTICNGSSTVITAVANGGTAPYIYTWSNALGSGSSKTVSPIVTTTYIVTVVDNNGCSATDAVVVNVSNPPGLTTSPNSTICNGAAVSLSATATGGIAPYTYSWNNQLGVGQNKVASPTITTTYSVTATDNVGCSTTANIIVTVLQVSADAGPDQTITCSSPSATLTASGGGTYSWSTGQNNQTITVSPSDTTIYSVTVTGTNGCTAIDDVIVNVNINSINSGISGPNTICALDGAFFQVSPPVTGATYLWNFDGATPATSTASSLSVTWPTSMIGTTRNVSLTVTTADGCSETYTHPINISQNATANAGPDREICEGASTTLGGTPAGPTGSSFVWTPNLYLNSNTVANPLATPPVTITYTLTTAINGCTKTDEITVTVNTNLNPLVSASASPDPICAGKTSTLTATASANGGQGAPFQYVWSSLGAGQTKTTPALSTTTTYTVTVIDKAQCTATNTVTVDVTPCGSIGDYVWVDTDGDGVQDPTEIGLNGVTVILKDALNNMIATTVTSTGGPLTASGYYIFPDLVASTYKVMFMSPTAYYLTDDNSTTSNDNNDSDADPITGTTSTINLGAGEVVTNVDAGLYQAASLGNYVWEDADKDGVQDATELGVNGVTVLLKNAAGATLQSTTTANNPTTGAAGYYQFSNLAPGDYIVMFMTPAGYNETSANTTTDGNDSDADPATGNAPLTNLVSGESDQTIDAGIYRPATIGDYVWRDTDGDGIQDPTESGINGITVVLKDASGATVATTTTANNPTTGSAGYYQFSVDPGTYAVMVMVPSGNTVSPSDAIGSTDVNDSDINPTTGTSPNITVTSGSTNQTIDAGLYQTASLGNYVWEDSDKDGVQDATELGVNGVTVLLKNAAGATLQSTTTTTNPTTGAAGYYQFSNLAPGDYVVMFMTPAGYNETSANTTTDGSDSDADPATGNAPLTNLVSGESDQTIDAGIYRPATIGDYVWRDTDGDGIQDPTESGINGITVVLKDASGATVATTTTANNPTTGAAGYYQFSVDPGTYAVMVMVPAGSTVSPNDAVGSTDVNDSDINPTTGTSPNITVTSGSTNQTIDAGLYQTASLGNYV
jgi:hypothetical protein